MDLYIISGKFHLSSGRNIMHSYCTVRASYIY